MHAGCYFSKYRVYLFDILYLYITQQLTPTGCRSKQFQAPGKLNFKSDEFLEQVKEEGPSAFRSNLQEVIFSDLEWGFNSYAKVERLQSHYYRVYVSPEHIQNGLILNCKSADKDSFKLFVYHHSGVLLSCDDSEVSRDGRSTHITKFFNTRFPCYHLVNGVENSQNHVSRRKGSVKEDVPVARNAPESASSDANMSNANASADTVAALPPLFHCVEKFETCDYTLPGPGYYLVAVFGENFIAKSAYTISVVSTKNNSPEIQHIQSQDTAMLQLRDQIRDLQGRYVEVRVDCPMCALYG